jgi:MoaA/NifB/PqqE/SkfB family radical SAM enzyme
MTQLRKWLAKIGPNPHEIDPPLEEVKPEKSELSIEEIRKSLPENFCPLPFTHLFLYPTGKVNPCCESNYLLGNMKESTVEEIWNGKPLQALREEFLSGNIKTCAHQVKYKQCHLDNERLLRHTDPSVIQKNTVQSFDFILNGKCNLECVMCPIWTLPNQVYDSTTFWDEGQETIFPNLKMVKVKSGEPFIQKDTYRLIKLISEVNKDCRWDFTTNGHYKLTPSILEHLDRIQIDVIKVSIDSLKESVYSQIRKRGDLEKAMATLKGFVDYRNQRLEQDRSFSLGINMAVQQLNWQEPPALIDLCEKDKIDPIFIFVFEPDEESILTLPVDKKVEILEYYLSYLEEQKQKHGEYRWVAEFTTIVLPVLGAIPEDLRGPYTERWLSFGGTL